MPNLIVEKNELFVSVKINRPESLNALNINTLTELLQLLKEIKRSSSHLIALILTGEGSKAFIAGADIKEMIDMNPLQMLDFCSLGQEVTFALENAPYLTLAAVNGYALGGGLEMALACDFIYASQTAKLGLPEITLGIIPGFGGTQRLARAIGQRQAKEMILSGKMITADEAKSIGIVNQVFAPELLMPSCEKFIQNISKYSLTAIRQAKEAINNCLTTALSEALVLEKNLCAVSFATPERELSMKAFLNKQK